MTSIAGLRVRGVGAGARSCARSSAVLRHQFSHATDFVDYFFDAVAAVLGGKDFRSRIVAVRGRDAHLPRRTFERADNADLPVAGKLLQEFVDGVAQGLLQFRISQ